MEFRNLNLSSRPFYNVNLLAIILTILYIFSILFSFYTAKKLYSGFKISEDTKIKMENLSEELKNYTEENRKLNLKLNSIDKKSIIEKAEEVNGLVLQRSFSWSRLLESLEETLPEEVRLISLSTSKSKEGIIKVRMAALSSKRDGLLQTIEALKQKPFFKNIQPVQFQDEERSGALGKKFEITFSYLEKDIPFIENEENCEPPAD